MSLRLLITLVFYLFSIGCCWAQDAQPDSLGSQSDGNRDDPATMSLNYRLNKAIRLRTKFENNYESMVVMRRQNNDFRWAMGFSAEY